MVNAIQQFEQYFNGSRKIFNLKINLDITAFYQNVLFEVKKIPYGETCSYKTIAKNIFNPKSYRAVGNANAINPLTIIIPCNRLINDNGKAVNYGGGIKLKKKLIMLESLNKKTGYN